MTQRSVLDLKAFVPAPQKYRLGMAKAPTLQPWGLRVLYLTDPTGVLWHIADRRASSDHS